jgi:serine/threonine-protein kinase
MATVHMGRLDGPAGFARVVAIKRLHPHIAANHELAARFFDEARLATRIHHANVIHTLDVVLDGDTGLVVMEYVQGETLGRLLQVACKSSEPPEPRIVSAILNGVLYGLHAAHLAKSEHGEPLGIVHRDVSPQNILVGSDGVARLLDFGIAKATAQTSVTPGVKLKGKAAYMAPEQLRGGSLTPHTDVFAAAIVLWESLVGRRLFLDETEAKTLSNVLTMAIEPPSAFAPGLPPELDRVVLRGLERDPRDRFASAREMALALEQAVSPATSAEVGAWVEDLAREALACRTAALGQVEAWSGGPHLAAPISLQSPAYPPASRTRRRVLSVAVFSLLLVGGAGSLAHSLRVPVPVATTLPRRHLIEAHSSEMGPEIAPSEPAASPLVRTERVVGKRSHAKVGEAKADCSPPYSYSATGHKVYKPQCL